ncbi:hypothetical protein AM629_17345 [Photorhabdus heterorhabditis]|uniref:Type 1 fimbrial protein n=1 Tax=Photorhabdus heterorhabditis TaxID=880156 RepID=A0ABR5K875_9GAMM|nr:hypothetical protein [Photorhabdus heterorhabditis]KOY60797.1 hypothetical protein AM629_17345 [Photorhabdus heterorhabditis]
MNWMKLNNKKLMNSCLIGYRNRTKYWLLVMMMVGLSANLVLPVQAQTEPGMTTTHLSLTGFLLPPTCVLSVNGMSGGTYSINYEKPYRASQFKDGASLEETRRTLKFTLSGCNHAPLKGDGSQIRKQPTLFVSGEKDTDSNNPYLFGSSLSDAKWVGMLLSKEGGVNSGLVEVKSGKEEPVRFDFEPNLDNNDGQSMTFSAVIAGDKGHRVVGGSLFVVIHFEFEYA